MPSRYMKHYLAAEVVVNNYNHFLQTGGFSPFIFAVKVGKIFQGFRLCYTIWVSMPSLYIESLPTL